MYKDTGRRETGRKDTRRKEDEGRQMGETVAKESGGEGDDS